MNILVVEDDADIAEIVCICVEGAGYTVEHAAAGDEGLRMATENPYRLIVLDLMLPRLDGLDVCKTLRARGNMVPILMLTARSEVRERVRGLAAGADDYLPKPFEVSELLARVHALLRRDSIHRSSRVHIADLEIDRAQRRVWRAGVEINLSRREFDLLEALVGQEGGVLTREVIQEQIWKNEKAASSTVDVYIAILRKKIDAGHAVKLIYTVHGIGYAFRVPRDGDGA